MTSMRRPCVVAVIGGLLLTGSAITRSQEPLVDLETILARVGVQLERRYERAEHIISTEMVWVRSFTHDMRSTAPPRRLEFERRVEWGAAKENGLPTVTVFRELLSVNGREPQQRDLDACLTPLSETEDPLSALLPVQQGEFEFSLGELEWMDDRRVARLDYVPLEEGPTEVVWDEDCVSISLPGRSRSEAWVDVESGDVLRLDERLARRFEFREPADRPQARQGLIALERDDVSIRYQRVTFENPAETLMLPRSIERSWTLRGAGFVPRYYRSQQFSNHRRFVTAGRLVGATGSGDDPEVR